MNRKYLLLLAGVLALTGCSAGSSDEKNPSTSATSTIASQSTDVSSAPSEVETSTKTQGEEPTAPAVWETTAPAKIRNSLSDEQVWSETEALIGKGELIFTGAENEGFYPDDLDWLRNSSADDILAIVYSCDDRDHAGWGVLGLNFGAGQQDFAAYADRPDRKRLITITVEDMCQQAMTDSPGGLTFSLGAWNGGHIHGVYMLRGSDALSLSAYLEQVEKDKGIIHTYNGSLSNPDAIPEAVAVYDYLKDVWAGDNCITGQMESTWMGSPDYEMNYIYDCTDRYPAIRGLDFMHNDFAGVVKRAKEWWEKGGIVTICWHTGSDFASGYNESLKTELDWENAFTPGTKEYDKLLADMDRAVPFLQQLEDAGVPVLWRPFHELDGGWFWWSRGGSEYFVHLWQLMYSRYVDYWGLDNLIWVLGYSHNGGDLGAWYPGDDYVDLIGGDSYDKGANKSLYEDVSKVAAPGMPIVFHECGTIPTEDQMVKAGTDWLFFMVWHTDYITDGKSNTKDSIDAIYNSDYFITLDELPAFK